VIVRPRRRRAGFTLLEVMVASTILMGIVLILTYAFLPVKRTTAEATIGLDQDAAARQLLAQVRRELRQSGTNGDGEDMAPAPVLDAGPVDTLSAPGAPLELLRFRMRTGPGDGDWSPEIVYRAIPDGTFKGTNPALDRWLIQREQFGTTVGVVQNVSRAVVERSGELIQIRLELSLTDPNWTDGSNPPPPITRTYEDRVQLMNRGT
jgi:prepilin-type N-terminal cleavage/methylation domain-containing protein